MVGVFGSQPLSPAHICERAALRPPFPLTNNPCHGVTGTVQNKPASPLWHGEGLALNIHKALIFHHHENLTADQGHRGGFNLFLITCFTWQNKCGGCGW